VTDYTDADLVDAALEALLHFGGQISRDQAETLLPRWARYPELDRRDVVAVLSHFGKGGRVVNPGLSGPGC
jgi:hypothetical protein